MQNILITGSTDPELVKLLAIAFSKEVEFVAIHGRDQKN